MASSLEDPQLQIVAGYGSFCGKLREAAVFAHPEAQVVLHPVGKLLALRNVATEAATFTVESARVQAVTAVAVSLDRSLLACCEECTTEPRHQVSIYELGASASNKPLRTLEELGDAVGRLCAAAFGWSGSGPGLLCLAAASAHKAQIFILDWRQNLVLDKVSLRSAADRVSFWPLGHEVVCASGPRMMHVWGFHDGRLHEMDTSYPYSDDGQWKPTSSAQQSELEVAEATFVDHAWIGIHSKHLAVCSSDGIVHVASVIGTGMDRMLQYMYSLEVPIQPTSAGEAMLHAIRSIRGGFLLGASQGRLLLYKSPGMNEEGVCRHVCTTRLRLAGSSSSSAVVCMDVAGQAGAESVLVGFNNRTIGTLSLALLWSSPDKTEAEINVVGCHSHSGPITSMDMAVQRPVLVTACKESGTVKVWDYQAAKLELTAEFPGDEITGIAVHPLGYFLAICCSDRLRFMQILSTELKVSSEFSIRGMRSIRFSHGGHLIAGIQGKMVLVFSTRTQARLATLRGHATQVIGLAFDPEDTSMITCGEDGSVCKWCTHTFNKLNHDGGARAGGEGRALAAAANGLAFVSLTEHTKSFLRAHKDGLHQETFDISLAPHLHMTALQAHASPRGLVLLGGGNDGVLRIWSSVDSVSREDLTFGLHTTHCSAIALSADAKCLATAGEDGSIFFMRVTGLANSNPQSARNWKLNVDVVMINRGEIQFKMDEIQELLLDCTVLKKQIEDEDARCVGECGKRVEEARKEDRVHIQNLRNRYEALQLASTAKERENLKLMKQMEAAHVQVADNLEKVYDKKIRFEADRYAALKQELRQTEAKLDSARAQAQQALENRRHTRRKERAEYIAEKDSEIQALKDIFEFSQRRFDVMLDQEGLMNERSVAEMQAQMKQEVDQQRSIENKLKKEQDTVLRGLDMMEKDRERITKEQQEAVLVMNSISSEAEKMRNEVAILKDERRQRESLLREKEVEITSFKTKVDTLKKFKHVLDFRLREVTLSLEPKDQMISQLYSQLRELELEFEHHLEAQKQMEDKIAEKALRITELGQEAARLRGVLNQRERTIYRFTNDLHSLTMEETDARQWPKRIRKIYREHMDPSHLPEDIEESPPAIEMNRQIKNMERKAQTLAVKGATTEEVCRADIMAKTQENALLIHELDELRADKKELEKKAQDLQLRVREIESKIGVAKHSALAIADVNAREGDNRTEPKAVVALPASVRDFFSTTTPLVPPRGRFLKPSSSHIPEEQKQDMQRLLAMADLNNQQIQMQRIEQRLLQDQLDQLTKVRTKRTDASAAGAGIAAVRQAMA